jgi:NitT/TauT family transport system permease protein
MILKNTRTALVGIIFIIFIWFLIYFLKVFNPLLLPSPIGVFRTFLDLIFSGNLNHDILVTLFRWILGFGLGMIIGVPFGLLTGISRIFHSIFDFPLDFFRSLPVTALFPLFLLLFGIGDGSKIMMVFAATFPVMAINAAYGVLHSSKKRILMAKSFGANMFFIFKRIIFWEALPQTFVGMRLALSISLIVVILSEMFIGTRFGLGQRLFDAYSINMVEQLYSILILAGILGYCLSKIFISFEKRALIWKGK